jgi:opacity protein-like surface antigen
MKNALKVLVVMAVLVTGITGYAQESVWDWSITPYAWMAGMEGDVGVGRAVTTVDQSFSDVLNDLTFAAMVSVDGNNETVGVMGDLFFVNLDDKTHTPLGEFKGEVEQWIGTVMPYVRITSNEGMTVDVGAGVRYIETDLDVSTPLSRDSKSKSWIDPLFFARVRAPIAEKCFVSLAGDFGGGVESDLTWQILAAAGYSMSKNLDLMIGYRHLYVDYESGRFVYDMETSGFAIGLKIDL